MISLLGVVCPCGSPYGLLPTMVPFGLDVNLLPVMGGMRTSRTKHSNRCASPRFLCHALDVSLFLSRVFGG